MPVQDITSQELLEAAHRSIPSSEASNARYTMVPADSSHTDNYWLGEYLDSQAFPQMQYEHLMFQGMSADSQVSSGVPEGTAIPPPLSTVRQQQDSFHLFAPPLMSFAGHGHVSPRQQHELQSSRAMTPIAANDTTAFDPNAPANILLQAQKQPRVSDCFAQDMIMTTPNLPAPTVPNSMRASPSPATASGNVFEDQLAVVKVEDDESPRLSMSSIQAVDGSTSASKGRTPSPFVEDALRSANALIHRGGTAQSVTYVQQHAPEVVVQQMQLQIHQEQQQLQMQMQAFAQMYGQPFVSGHHGEGATTGSNQETAVHLPLSQPFQSLPAQTFGQVSPQAQLTAPVDDRAENISTKSQSLLQLQQLQDQAYSDNLLVGISGITDQETLQALTDAAASSSLSQDLVFGSNLRSLLIEGSSQPKYTKHELYDLALPQSAATPSSSNLVMRNVHRSRRTSPYPATSSPSARNHSSSHDDYDNDEDDNHNDRHSVRSQTGSTSPFPSSSKTSNKHSYPNNNYPHKCKHPGCERTFASVGLLKSHIVSHNEDKKYWCNLCSYDGVTPRPPAPPAWPGAPVHIPEVKRYKRNHDLLRHKREQHPPIEVKIQREVERQMAKEARKQKNAAERRERNTVGLGAGRNGGGRRGEIATTSTPTEVDTAAYMAIARETAMRAYYMNAGIDPGVHSSNNSNNRSNLLVPSTYGEQTPQIIHQAHSGQMMQQLQALQLQQQHHQLQPQYWMHNATTPTVQAMNNALLLQQQQQQQQQQQPHQHHPRAMTLLDTMNTNIPYSTGMSTNYGSTLLLPTPAPTAHHSRSGSTHGDITGGLRPSVQFPHDTAEGDNNTNMRGAGPTRRALARSTVRRIRGRASTVDEDQKGENFHPYAGRCKRTLHHW
ncbi:hypothetical protein BGZ72_000187 [Mortierella alpina]|nr:hypothetical protein BGZ72_000187 [Mortierella alpina]